MSEDWKRGEQDQLALGAYVKTEKNQKEFYGSRAEIRSDGLCYWEDGRVTDPKQYIGEENGDTDWYDPTTMPPVDGEPVYLKLNLIVKAKYTPKGSATWELVQDLNEAKGEILSWQKRED